MAKKMTTENISKKDEGVIVKKSRKPIIVETIHSTADMAEKELKRPTYEKHVITGSLPVPVDCIRCIVLVDYKGMLDELYVGDVIDLPTRRFKTEKNNGRVKEYEGPRIPNKQR